MKKNQIENSHSGFNRKNQHTNPRNFPKKQFEFIYREKDDLPSSQAFQSIIFMKSKKCDPKSSHSMQKNAQNCRKPHVQELKQVITEIQKQLNQQQRRKNKKVDDNIRSQALKNTSNSIGNEKNFINDNYKNKSSHRLNKGQKIDTANSDNVKHYKNLLSPTKKRMQKIVENKTQSSKFGKSTQETFRNNTKGNEKQKDKKEKRCPSPYFDEPEDYILVGDQFVSINFKQAEAIQERLLSSRDYFHHIIKDKALQQHSYGVQSPILQDQKAERVFQQYLISDDKSSEPTPLNNSKAQRSAQGENELMVLQKYLVSKVKLIQRWWRTILQNRNQDNNLPAEEDNGLEEIQLTLNSKIFKKQKSETNQASFDFCTKMIGTVQIGNSSPIKLVDQFFCSNPNIETEVVSSRQNAAKLQLQTHKSILEKLLISKKITPEIYIQRKGMIEAKYYSELQQIQELRRIIQKNVIKAAQIQKKTQQDVEALQKKDVVVNNNLLDQIFGVQFAECFQDQHQSKLTQVPALQNELVSNRMKSQGCHYQSETVKTSLYKKQNKEAQDYQQDFQDYDQENQNNAEFNEFCSQNVASGEPINSNFKDLFNEFKLRQQVKIEIDKRAAIQMGVLIQEIPEQIKDQVVAIDTSLNSVHRFLLSFFKYYILYNKYEFLRLINMPFGFNFGKRLKALQGYPIDESFQEDQDGVIQGLDTIIPEQMFEQFYQKVYSLGQGIKTSAKIANFQFEKTHNKAIFDCFNESLNYFRPYFFINGPPYPWNYSQKALTFYFIAQQNIQQVFQKTQFKVLKWSSTLCGLILNKFLNPIPSIQGQKQPQEVIEHYRKANHSLLNETREDRLIKSQKIQVIDTKNQWNEFMEEQTFNSLKIAQQIFDKVVEQMALLLLGGFTEQVKPSSSYQNCEKQMKTGIEFFQSMSQNSSLSEFQIF